MGNGILLFTYLWMDGILESLNPPTTTLPWFCLFFWSLYWQKAQVQSWRGRRHTNEHEQTQRDMGNV